MSDNPPEWDEHTVQIDGWELPTYQIEDVDGAIVFPVIVEKLEAFTVIPHGSAMVKTPEETFLGRVVMLAIEHGELTIHVDRVDRSDRPDHVMSEEQHNEMAAERTRQLRRGTEHSEGGA